MSAQAIHVVESGHKPTSFSLINEASRMLRTSMSKQVILMSLRVSETSRSLKTYKGGYLAQGFKISGT